jgi:hypothetical protein
MGTVPNPGTQKRGSKGGSGPSMEQRASPGGSGDLSAGPVLPGPSCAALPWDKAIRLGGGITEPYKSLSLCFPGEAGGAGQRYLSGRGLRGMLGGQGVGQAAVGTRAALGASGDSW